MARGYRRSRSGGYRSRGRYQSRGGYRRSRRPARRRSSSPQRIVIQIQQAPVAGAALAPHLVGLGAGPRPKRAKL